MKIAFALVVMAACAGGAGPQPAHPATPAAGDAALVLGDLAFEDATGKMTFFQLAADGRFTAATGRELGRLAADGTFTFTGVAVTARLDGDGRIEIRGPTDLPATTDLPGDLPKLLHDYDGVVRAGYVLQPDDTATIAHAPPLAFDAHDVLGERMHVRGLTPATRRTALFLYVLLSVILS